MPKSSLISTFATSGVPEKAMPRSVAFLPTRACAGTDVMFDFTKSSVTGDISSGLNGTPAAPGVFGYRYATSM